MRILRTALELLSRWLFPTDYEGQEGMYAVVWCDGYDSRRPPGRRMTGRHESLAWSDRLTEAVAFMRARGPAAVKAMGGGTVFVMAPEGFPVRELQIDPPAELAASLVERARNCSQN